MSETTTASPSLPSGATLCRTLLDSRQRWRDLVMGATDLAYETDAWGRFVFVMPDPVLGWSAATLLGQPAELMLAGGADINTFNPFRVTGAVRRRQAWVKRADGSAVMLAFSAMPIFDGQARIVGARGLGFDWTEFDRASGHVAAALRRSEVLAHIVWCMGQEVLAPRMMQSALDTLVSALGAEGAAVIEAQGEAGPLLVHCAGGGANELLTEAAALLVTASEPTVAIAKDGRPILVAVCHTRFGANAGVALWRSPGSRGWDAEDSLLIGAAAHLIRMVLEHEAIQREMARQARTDPLTGLLNRRAFLEEMARHVDRLDREEQPGTLLFADLDYFKPVNDRLGHEVGDQVLLRTAEILRNAVRPSDLVARLGGDEFALWMDGADRLTAAERGDHLCKEVPKALCEIARDGGPAPTMSVGIAIREAATHEPVDNLLRRADQAMYEVKRSGRGHWRVANEASL